MLDYKQRFIDMGEHEMEALNSASREVITRQHAFTSIPKRLSLIMREIWHMQPQLQHPTRKRALRTLQHKRFRAAYDFLLLRQSIGEPDLAIWCDWWTGIQTKAPIEQEKMCANLGNVPNKSKKYKKRRRRTIT
jgi:poly(A) polymerase